MLSVKGLAFGPGRAVQRRHELGEVGKGVVRSGRGLRVVLHGEERQLAMAHPFDGAVVQIEVGDLERGRARHPVRIANYREAMVLGGDEHLTGAQIAHRMIAAAVAVGQLGRRSAEGEPDQLMPEADAERRQPRAGELANGVERVVDRRRIARAVRKEEPVGL